MEEKLIETKEEQPTEPTTEPKKVYTPPTLTVYGKLTELTAGGGGSVAEHGDERLGQPHYDPSKRA